MAIAAAGAIDERFDAPFGDDRSRMQAVLCRDPRADGMFVYAVRTTGVYCRPVCHARKPRVENVRFYAGATEAERAGFRPCKLCKPDADSQLRLGRQLSVRPAAVLFADIKGYSRLVATWPPDQAIGLIEAMQSRLGTAVAAKGGTIHKQLGDGFMAVFGDRRSKLGDARHAIEAALMISWRMRLWNRDRQEAGEAPIGIGIGVHYGAVAIRASETDRLIVGDTVNIAHRLERLTRRMDAEIIVSDEVMRATGCDGAHRLRNRFRWSARVELKGCGARAVHGV